MCIFIVCVIGITLALTTARTHLRGNLQQPVSSDEPTDTLPQTSYPEFLAEALPGFSPGLFSLPPDLFMNIVQKCGTFLPLRPTNHT